MLGEQGGHAGAQGIQKCACACESGDCGACTLVTWLLCQPKRRGEHGSLCPCLMRGLNVSDAGDSAFSLVTCETGSVSVFSLSASLLAEGSAAAPCLNLGRDSRHQDGQEKSLAGGGVHCIPQQ